MIIVLEGCEASGKSTLAHKLAKYLNWPVEHSPGPCKSYEEFNTRVKHFLQLRNTICDRHPVVSERIYGTILRGTVMTERSLAEMYLHSKKFTIYCRSEYPVHVIKGHDSAEHLEQLGLRSRELKEAYDKWALEEADYIYRGGEIKPLFRAVGAFIP